MKKIINLSMIIIIFFASILTIVQAQWIVSWDEWKVDKSKPTDLLYRVHYEANDEAGKAVEVTPLNKVQSNIFFLKYSIFDC